MFSFTGKCCIAFTKWLWQILNPNKVQEIWVNHILIILWDLHGKWSLIWVLICITSIANKVENTITHWLYFFFQFVYRTLHTFDTNPSLVICIVSISSSFAPYHLTCLEDIIFKWILAGSIVYNYILLKRKVLVQCICLNHTLESAYIQQLTGSKQEMLPLYLKTRPSLWYSSCPRASHGIRLT